MGVTEESHGELAKCLRIPITYYRRMKNSMPELLAENVTAWLRHVPTRQLRISVTEDGCVCSISPGRVC